MAAKNIVTREMVHKRIERVRRVLLAEWDPFYVGENPKLADEYDSYLPEILAALDADAAPEVIAELLLAVETGWGEDPLEERRLVCLAVARQLVEGASDAACPRRLNS